MRSYMMVVAAVMALGGAALAAAPALAAEHQVQMLNKGTGGMMVFEPSLLKIAPGDVVHFVATDKGHNVMSIEGMAPEGAAPFQSKMNEDFTVTFDKAGVYGIECKPHYTMGMVGLVVVGDAVNATEAKAVAHKGKAKKRFEELFTQLGQ